VFIAEDVDGDASPDLAVSEFDDYGNLDGMKVGPISTGEIPPFSSTKLEIIWNPSYLAKSTLSSSSPSLMTCLTV